MTQDLTDLDETGKIRLQSDLNENTKLNTEYDIGV